MSPTELPRRPVLIVEASLKEIDLVFANDVYEPVLLSQPSRPVARERMPQRLGFADARERIAKNSLDEIQGS